MSKIKNLKPYRLFHPLSRSGLYAVEYFFESVEFLTPLITIIFI